MLSAIRYAAFTMLFTCLGVLAESASVAGFRLVAKLPCSEQALCAFQYTSDRDGWVWERGGRRLWITEDGGANWRETKSPVAGAPGDYVSRVFPASAGSARVWTGNGRILGTTDGGRIWATIAGPPSGREPGHKYDVVGLEFDGPRGWASVGVDPDLQRGIWTSEEIYLTTDGGHTWARVWRGESPWNAYHRADIDGFAFADSDIGLAFGGATILRTTDGGRTWVRIPGPLLESRDYEPNPIVDIVFMDNRRGWLLKYIGSIFKTDDGGATWTKVLSGAKFAPLTGTGLPPEVCMDAAHGWLVTSAGTLFESNDGGSRWSPVRVPKKDTAFVRIGYSRIAGCRVSDSDGSLYGFKRSMAKK